MKKLPANGSPGLATILARVSSSAGLGPGRAVSAGSGVARTARGAGAGGGGVKTTSLGRATGPFAPHEAHASAKAKCQEGGRARSPFRMPRRYGRVARTGRADGESVLGLANKALAGRAFVLGDAGSELSCRDFASGADARARRGWFRGSVLLFGRWAAQKGDKGEQEREGAKHSANRTTRAREGDRAEGALKRTRLASARAARRTTRRGERTRRRGSAPARGLRAHVHRQKGRARAAREGPPRRAASPR